jgi:3-methyl-2-oxobutanoate hydroxymethyltransferase
VPVPTIGIGAGPHCDGQVMVINDIAGLFDEFKPKFVRRYGDLAAELEKIARAFVDDVREGRFPGPDESYE